MSRRVSKPSLKNYLSTGKVLIEEPQETCDPSIIDVGISAHRKTISADGLLGIFSEEDIYIWGPVFEAGAEIKKDRIDLIEMREFFRTMDRVKFTLFVLKNEKATMQIIRSSVQIREPFILFLLWDDAGIVSIYLSDERLVL